MDDIRLRPNPCPDCGSTERETDRGRDSGDLISYCCDCGHVTAWWTPHPQAAHATPDRVEELARFLNRRLGPELAGHLNWSRMKELDKDAWREDARAILKFLDGLNGEDIDTPLMSEADWARLHEYAKADADKPRRQCLACGVSFEDNGRDFCGPTCKAHRG